jgi:acyl-CoA reductase-like NAD-dependent aldehyde dehydrogenase
MESAKIINQEIDAVMQKAWKAFRIYKNYSLKERKAFLYAIADELENAGDELIRTCMEETNLPEARLKNEKARTIVRAGPGLMPGLIPQFRTVLHQNRI